jgi:ActR/RegA family two-component response regulator
MANDAVVHLIDDDDALRDSLAFLLNTARIEVRSYESAQVFLDALPRAEPGCIITDVRMPGISGLQRGAGAAVSESGRAGMTRGRVPLLECVTLGQRTAAPPAWRSLR